MDLFSVLLLLYFTLYSGSGSMFNKKHTKFCGNSYLNVQNISSSNNEECTMSLWRAAKSLYLLGTTGLKFTKRKCHELSTLLLIFGKLTNSYLFSLLLASLYLIILRVKNCEYDFVVLGLSRVVYNWLKIKNKKYITLNYIIDDGLILLNGEQHTDLSKRVVVITLRISSPILFSSINILQYESQDLMLPSSRKWNNSRSNKRGIIASATAIKSFGTFELLEWLLMPWSEQNPSAFITLVSPQSHAPPACDRNILKSCVEWSPFLKQFRHIDMHGEIPHVRHRYATTCGIQTRPHFAWLSYVRTGFF